MSRLLLKARPTPAQLADRLSEPRPDGIELYLDLADLADAAARDRVVANLERCRLEADFDLLIEGPIRSLDGEFFDLARDAEPDREVVRRLAELAGRLGARAVNVHLIAPRPAAAPLTPADRAALLEACLPLADLLVAQVTAAGAIPTVENMPPVLRMRESSFYFTAIGLAAEDLVWLCARVPGLRATLDLSHTGLYLNARAYAAGRAMPPDTSDDYEPLLRFVRTLPPCADLPDYARALGPYLVTSHVANASGLLGEGAAYDQGDLPLDDLVAELAPRVRYFVTETLERDNDRAVEMRRALAAMRRAVPAVTCS